LSKYMAPEVGIPSLNELVQSEAEGGQAHEHRVGAPRDFEFENRVFANPLIPKVVSLNPSKILG